MAIGKIIGKVVDESKRKEAFDEARKPVKNEPGDTIFVNANSKFIEVLQICKWSDENTLLATKLKFYSDIAYQDWILNGGPDKDLKDPKGEYFVVRKWEKK